MKDQMKELLSKRTSRSIAIFLNYKDNEIDQHLPPHLRAELRKKFLDTINDIYDFSLDVLNSLDQETVVLNEEFFQRMEDLILNSGKGKRVG